jgi:hypothetical protein
MLPDVTDIALHEEPGHIVINVRWQQWLDVNGVLESLILVVIRRWRTRVVVKATDAADGAVILFGYFVWVASHFDCTVMWSWPATLFFLTLRTCTSSLSG